MPWINPVQVIWNDLNPQSILIRGSSFYFGWMKSCAAIFSLACKYGKCNSTTRSKSKYGIVTAVIAKFPTTYDLTLVSHVSDGGLKQGCLQRVQVQWIQARRRAVRAVRAARGGKKMLFGLPARLPSFLSCSNSSAFISCDLEFGNDSYLVRIYSGDGVYSRFLR